MAQKQDNIFSRLEDIETSFPARREDLPRLTSSGAVEQEVPGPERSYPACEADVSADSPRIGIAPEPAPTEVFVHRQTCSEAGVFESLENAFVLVAPRTFLMGSPDGEAGRGSDETIHEVTITKAFCIQKTPVTQGQWKAVMGAVPAFFQDGGHNLPVESVSWNEVQEFLKKLNSKRCCAYRLPTEAEWECACRAGTQSALACGDIAELYCGYDSNLWEVGWYCGNSGRRTWPVAQKIPNAWQLHDMHGNVGEWCQDWYGDYSAEACTDPRGPKSGSRKVVRGGAWVGSAKSCRSAARIHWPPGSRSDFIGFRLAKDP